MKELIDKLTGIKSIKQDSWNRRIVVKYDLDILYPTTLDNIPGAQYRDLIHEITNPVLVEALALIKGNETDDNKRAINGMLDKVFDVAPIFSPVDLSIIEDEETAISTNNTFLEQLNQSN